MNQKEETKHVKRMIVIMSVLILFGIALFLGTSYALFSVLVEGKQSISITTKTLEVKLQDGEYIREDPRGTMTDKQGKKTKPYTFTITNTGTMEAYYKLYLIEEGPIGEKELIDTYYLKYELKGDDGSQQEGRIGELKQFYYSKEIQPGEENKVTYELRIWLDKDTPNSEQGKSYQSKVAVDANQLNYPNPPVLADNMIPVVYDENEKRWEKADIEQAWYNYDKQEWANAVTVTNTTRANYRQANSGTEVKMADILQMWVWIPRYSYTIKSEDGEHYYGKKEEGRKDEPSQALPGEIDVKFIGVEDKDTKGSAQYTGKNPKNWYTPPGFTFGEEELSGIWIGKFETGYSSGEGTGAGVTSAGLAQHNTEEPKKAIIKPNVYSWRDIRISTIDLVSRQMIESDNVFGFDQSTYDSHAAKNTEWALISYLTQSKYGKYGNSLYTGENKIIYKNNCSTYITGCSGGTPSATSLDICNNTYDVEEKGTGASSTGNITGIYDISGGAWEYIMGVFNKMSGNTKEINSGYSGLLSDDTTVSGRSWPAEKYYDLYTSDDVNTACGGKICNGHALNEITDWYKDYYHMLKKEFPWLVRGRPATDNDVIGPFSYAFTSGAQNIAYSFRQVLTPIKNE